MSPEVRQKTASNFGCVHARIYAHFGVFWALGAGAPTGTRDLSFVICALWSRSRGIVLYEVRSSATPDARKGVDFGANGWFAFYSMIQGEARGRCRLQLVTMNPSANPDAK